MLTDHVPLFGLRLRTPDLAELARLRLTRQEWEKHRTIPVEIIGLEGCLPMFGLPAASA